MENNFTDVMYKLGGIESTLSSLNDKLDKFISNTEKQQDNHEARISKLEKREIQLMTLAAVIGTAASLLVSILFKWLNLH